MTSEGVRVTTAAMVQLADYPRGAHFGPHRLPDYEFVWVLSGSARWTVLDDGRGGPAGSDPGVVLTPGMLTLARSGTVDSYQWDQHRASRHAYVHFDICDRSGLPDETDWPVTRQIGGTPILEGLCSYLLGLAGQQSDHARARSDGVLGLLLDVFLTGPLEQPPELAPPVLAVTEHVRRSWASQGMRAVGVEELAAAAAISAGHLHRVFRQEYGCGPARALELVRLARAAVWLQRSNAGIAEVAGLTGFANPYHFSRRFSAVYQAPPGAFRRLPNAPDAFQPLRVAGLLPVAGSLLDLTGER